MIDWYLKKTNKTHFSELLDLYPINGQSHPSHNQTQLTTPPPAPQKPTLSIAKRWNWIVANKQRQPLYNLLCSRRMLSQSTVDFHIDNSQIGYVNHMGKESMAVPFFPLQGEKTPCSLQLITLDGEPFQSTGTNKVFQKGSLHDDGFFQAGADFNHCKILVIVESVIDAMTGGEIHPVICWLATGSTSYTKKLEHLKPHLNRLEKVIVFQDNDEAGTGFVNKIAGILKDKVFAVQWLESDSKGFDCNDLLKSGQAERIKQMLDDAIPVLADSVNADSLSLEQRIRQTQEDLQNITDESQLKNKLFELKKLQFELYCATIILAGDDNYLVRLKVW
ncbi:MAG: toprim domain-containing protein [Desulfamplus sp.]|nr:toprim domain-containing protein [Desulfamplus sp.]